jgi:hypothetical protein
VWLGIERISSGFVILPVRAKVLNGDLEAILKRSHPPYSGQGQFKQAA